MIVDVLVWVILGIAAAGTVIFTAHVCWDAGTALRDGWRDAHAVIEKTQEELSSEPLPPWEEAMLLAALCNPCQRRRQGVQVCICTAPCTGELACMGGFTDEDVKFLLGTGPEGTGQ